MFLILLILLGASLATPVLSRISTTLTGWVCAGAMAGTAALAIIGFDGSWTESVAWMPQIGIDLTLHMTGLSFVFTLLVLGIGAAVMIYSTKYLGSANQWSFYLTMMMFALAMLVLVLTDNLIVFYVAWELTTLCSFFLISRSGSQAWQPAIRTLLVTVAGGLILLAAVLTMAVATGTTSIREVLASPVWNENPTVTTVVAILVALAAFTKSAQFPFQFWLPDSMVAITPVSTYLHAATMVKAGIFALLQFSPIFASVGAWQTMLMVSGAITGLIGAIGALTKTDLKGLLAYSTMSQLGLLVLMIGVGSPAAIEAAVVHTVAHALFKSALFMSIGVIDHEAGTRDSRELTDMRLAMPLTKVTMVLGAASMAGIPPLLGFVSKEGLLTALTEAPHPPLVTVAIVASAVLTSICTFAYSTILVVGAFRGRGTTVIREPWSFIAAPLLIAVAGLVLGIIPFVLDHVMADAATIAVGADMHTHLALWHGINLPLMLSALIIGLGAVFAWGLLSGRVPTFTFPFRGIDIVEHMREGIISFGGKVGYWTGSNSTRRHLSIPVGCLVGIGIVGLVTIGDLPDVVGQTSRPLDWVLVALIAISVLMATTAHTRVAAIVVVGVAGFTMVIWFFSLGASDVALTQLMVEILTVCVMVLLLRRLPATFYNPPTRSRLFRISLSIAGGITASLGVWALTGRRVHSPVAEYYFAEGTHETGGANIVNTILVDFRALDTLGELSVLGVAGITIVTLLRARQPNPVRDILVRHKSPLAWPEDGTMFIRTVSKFVGPLAILLSIYLFFRGHQEPGGGFIAALIGGSGFALLYLSAPSDKKARIAWPYLVLIGSGIFVGAATGILGYIGGSYLLPLTPYIFGVKVTTSLIFDLGVYLAVIGLVVAAFNLLGREDDSDDEDAAVEKEAVQ